MIPGATAPTSSVPPPLPTRSYDSAPPVIEVAPASDDDLEALMLLDDEDTLMLPDDEDAPTPRQIR